MKNTNEILDLKAKIHPINENSVNFFVLLFVLCVLCGVVCCVVYVLSVLCVLYVLCVLHVVCCVWCVFCVCFVCVGHCVLCCVCSVLAWLLAWLGFSRPFCPVCEKDVHFKIFLKSLLKSINIIAIIYFKRIYLKAKIMFLDTLHVNYEMKMCYSLIYMKCSWLNLKELFMVRLSL